MCYSYRLFRWESPEGEEPHELALRSDQEALVELNDVGLQLAASFSGEGSILATGGEVIEYSLFFIQNIIFSLIHIYLFYFLFPLFANLSSMKCYGYLCL